MIQKEKWMNSTAIQKDYSNSIDESRSYLFNVSVPKLKILREKQIYANKL